LTGWEKNLWQSLIYKDEPPPRRSDHGALYDEKKNRLVIYGGWDKDQKLPFDDTRAFCFPAISCAPGKWRQIKTRLSLELRLKEAGAQPKPK
jgi:hypothetical protein